VPVVLVPLQPERGEFGQDVIGETGGDQQVQADPRVVGADQFDQLVADPFGRHDRDPVRHRRHRGHHCGIRGEPELRGEPGRPHHPQRVIGERVLRGARRPDRPVGDVLEAAVRIDEDPGRQPDRHRVHGEVAPGQIALQAVAVRDLRLA
jgi:hypothetical protein